MERYYHTIEPIFDQNSKVLILGTFPSVKSREAQFYYHHPQNRFWRVIAQLTGYPVPESIEDKTKMLLENKIALWDVLASCQIKGSSDSSIRNEEPNDIKIILDNAPIRRIFANGDKAYRLYLKHLYKITGAEITRLPSTSPANAAWTMDMLIEDWKQILSPIESQ